MSLDLLERPDTDERTSTGPGDVGHIIPPGEDKTSHELVMEARVFGNPVTAVCGYVFVPTKDATRLPLCATCKELVDELVDNGSAEDVTQ